MDGTNGIIAKCRSCNELLLEGDLAYRLCDAYFCPECVDHALVVCRRDDYYDYELLKNRRHIERDD